MGQKCTPSPHQQPQVNVMNLCFCIKDVIFNGFTKQYQMEGAELHAV